jgi:hypothetical protein
MTAARRRSPSAGPVLVTLVLASALAAGCGSEPAGPPTQIQDLTSGVLSGIVGTAITQPLRVRVTDAQGDGVAGIAVSFTVTSGGGTIDLSAAAPASLSGGAVVEALSADTTDGNGEAQAFWTLGTTAGLQTATATVTGLAAVAFQATAFADAPASSAVDSSAAFVGIAGGATDGPLAVRVADQYDNPVPDVAVAWSVLTGGGSVAMSSTRTDSTGVAEVDAMAGPDQGINLFAGQVAGLAPDTVDVVGVVGVADPIGDQFSTGSATYASHDVTFLGGAIVQGTLLLLHAQFAGTIVPAAATGVQPPRGMVAFWDLDLDQDTTTGYYPLRQCIGGPPLNFGTDAFVDLDPGSSLLANFQNPPAGAVVVARVDMLTDPDRCTSAFNGGLVAAVPFYRDRSVTLLIPLSFLQDDGVFDITTLFGSAGAGTVTDVVPDSLAYTFPGPPATATAPAAALWPAALRRLLTSAAAVPMVAAVRNARLTPGGPSHK